MEGVGEVVFLGVLNGFYGVLLFFLRTSGDFLSLGPFFFGPFLGFKFLGFWKANPRGCFSPWVQGLQQTHSTKSYFRLKNF